MAKIKQSKLNAIPGYMERKDELEKTPSVKKAVIKQSKLDAIPQYKNVETPKTEVTAPKSAFTMQGTGTGATSAGTTLNALDFLKKGSPVTPASLVKGELTSVGAKAEHQAATERVEEAKKEAAWTVSKPSTLSAGIEEKPLSTGSEAVKDAKAARYTAAQNYYALEGRKAVGDIRAAGKMTSTFDRAVELGARIEELNQALEHVSGEAATDYIAERSQLQREQKPLLEALTKAGYDAERAVEYEVRQVREKAAAEESEANRKWAQENKVLAAIGSIATAPVQGLDYLHAVTGNLGHNSTKDIEGYIPLSAADMQVTGLTQDLREGASADMGGVGKFLFDTGMSIADSTLLISTIGPAAGVVLGMSAASSTTRDALERGGTNAQALTAGLAAGAAEMIFEKFSIDGLIKMKDVKTVQTAVTNALKQAGMEASEEVFTEISNIITDGLIMGQNSNYNKAVQAYINSGMSADEAKKKAMYDNIAQVALAAAGGFLSGGVTGGVYSGGQVAVLKAREYANKALTGKSLKSANVNFDLLEQALQMPPATEAYQTAMAITIELDKDAKGEKISDAQWGRLRQQIAAQMGDVDVDAVDEAERPAVEAADAQIAENQTRVQAVAEEKAAQVSQAVEAQHTAAEQELADTQARIQQEATNAQTVTQEVMQEAARMAEEAELRAKGAETQSPATEAGADAQVRSSVTMATPETANAQRAVSEPSEAVNPTVAQKRTADYINAVLPKGAAKVELDTLPGSEDAYFDRATNTIKLNAAKYKSQRDLIHYLGHELVHNADAHGLGDEMTRALAEFGKKELGEDLWDSMTTEKAKRYYKFYTEEKGYSPMKATRATTSEKMANEVAADLMADIFDDVGVLERFAQADRTTAQKLRDALVKFRDRLIGEVAGVGDALVQGPEVRADVDKLIKTMDELLRKGASRGTMNKNEEERYSVEGREQERADREEHDETGGFVGGRRGGDRSVRPGGISESGKHRKGKGFLRGNGKASGIKEWRRAGRVTPAPGSPSAYGREYLADYGVVTYVVTSEAMRERGHQFGFTNRGAVYLEENIPEEYRVQVPAHELAHAMKQLGFAPYMEFVDRLMDEAQITPHTMEIMGEMAAHRGLDQDFEKLTSKEKFTLYDEFIAYVYGGYKQDAEFMLSETDDVFNDAAAFFSAMDNIAEQFKSRDKSADRRYSVSAPAKADTNAPEFREWFKDDSGLLTNEDGSPKLFLRGSVHAGATRFHNGEEAISKGIFFTEQQDVAEWYADQANTAEWIPPEEFIPRELNSWREAQAFVENDLGRFISLERDPDGWSVYTRQEGTGWKLAGEYENTPDGLAKFNADYGRIVQENNVVNPGWYSGYLSAENTLVYDAKGRNWSNIDGKGKWTNHLAEEAWAKRYDAVIIRNVVDGGSVGEFDENDVYSQRPTDVYVVRDSAQFKSAYNTGSFDRGNPDVRYSVSSKTPFKEQVHAALTEGLNENRFRALYIAETPNLLAEVGLGDLPMCMTASHVQDINHPKGEDYHWHGIPEGLIARLPELLSKPVMILDSDTRKGDVVIVTAAVDNDGNPVLVSARPNGSANVDGVRGPANFITSMYGKDRDFAGWVERNAKNGKVLYWNSKRTQQLFRLARLHLPAALTTLSSDTILKQHEGYVKEKIPERRFSIGGNTGNVNPDTGFERGSVADSFMRMWNVGAQDEALSMLEQSISRLAQIQAEQAEQQLADLRRAVLRPRVTESVAERNRQRVEQLIEKYGMMPQTGAAQQEVRLPEQIDDETRVAGAAQTLMAADVTNEVIGDELVQGILSGDEGLAYHRVGDKATLEQVDKDYERLGFRQMRTEWEHVLNGGEVTKLDIAKAEKLYVEACANKDVDAAMKLAAEIAAAATRAGQTVQAMTLLKKMTPSGQAYYIQKVVDRLNKDPRQKNPITLDEKLVKHLLAAKTRDEVNAAVDALIQSVADQVPVTLADKWNTWRYFAMLGNPRTHIRNLAGNAIFTPARLAKDVIGTGLERLILRDQRKYTKSLTASKELRDFAKQDAEEMKDILHGGGKYNPADQIRDRRTIFKRAKWLNTATQKNSELLEKEDWIFLSAAYQRALSHFLSARGADVASLTASPKGRKLLNEARSYAVNEAQRATYRDMSKLAGTLNHLKRNHKVLGVFLDGLVPFTKTPINIVKRGLEYSPLGLVKSLYDGVAKVRKGTMSGAELIDEVSANLTGTGVALLGVLLAHLGLLTGALGDDDEDKFEELQGEQAYSLKIGDTSYTIDWMAPVALPLFVGAEIYNTVTASYEDVEPGQVLSAVADGMASILEPMLSLSMLDGLNDALSSNKYGDSEDALWSVLSTVGTSYISQGVPTVMGQLARTIDPNRRTSFTQKGDGSVESMLKRFWQNSVQGKIPFYQNEKMAFVDAWGRVDTTGSIALRAFENFISPGYINERRTTDVEVELSRLAEELKDTAVLPDRAQKYFTVDKETYAMTQDEYQAHLIDRGQTSYRLVSDFIHDPVYAGLTDEERAEVISDIYDYAAQSAKYHTNEKYARDKWVGELDAYVAQGGDAVDYLAMKVQAGTSSISDAAYKRNDLSASEMSALILGDASASQRAPKSFSDPYAKGYVYELTPAQQAQYTETFDELFNERFYELYHSEEYRQASAEERKELVKDLRAEVSEDTKREMADWLYGQGIDSKMK